MNEVEFIVLAGSAGSFNIILDLVKNLPVNFGIPILVVIHRSYDLNYSFDEVVTEKSNLLIREITDKEEILDGVVYLAPPNYHVLIEANGVFSLDFSEKVLFSRPSIDVSLESAAEIYKNKLLAVLFSGASEDGAAGLLKIKNLGGITIVQDPTEASYKTMPNAAIANGAYKEILNVTQIKRVLEQLN